MLRSRGSPYWPPSAVVKSATPWSASWRQVVAVAVDVRLEVEQHVARLVVGEERAVHREDVGRGAAGEAGLELVPVGVPVGRPSTLTVIVRVGGVERVDDRLLAVELGRVAPDRVA